MALDRVVDYARMRGEQEGREVDVCGIEGEEARLARRGRRAGRRIGLAVTIRDLASREVCAGTGNRRSREQTTAEQELPPVEADGRLVAHTEGSRTAPVADPSRERVRRETRRDRRRGSIAARA